MRHSVLKWQYLKHFLSGFLENLIFLFYVLIGLETLNTYIVTVWSLFVWSIIFPVISMLTCRAIFDSFLFLLNVHLCRPLFFLHNLSCILPFTLSTLARLLFYSCFLISFFNLSPFPSVYSAHHHQIVFLH